MSIDLKQSTFYEYNEQHSTLARVINPDNSSTEYLYNSNGHYNGYKDYDQFGTFLHGMNYDSISPGQYVMVENPRKIISRIRFNDKGKIVTMNPKGSLPIHVKETFNGKQIYIDDLVITLLTFFVAKQEIIGF